MTHILIYLAKLRKITNRNRIRYRFLHCLPFDDLYFKFNENYAATFDAERFFLELIIVGSTLGVYPNVEAVVDSLGQFSVRG